MLCIKIPPMKKAKRIAAVDIGSNATRMLLGECGADGAFVEEMFLRFPLRLGGGGVWRDDKIQMLAEVLRAYRILLQAAKPDEWQAVATAAVRECENRGEVLDILRKKSGVRVRVLSGVEEAEVVGRFVARSFAPADVLNMDTGGGSTDCALVCGGEVLRAESFLVGTARRNGGTLREKQRMKSWMQTAARERKKIILAGSGGSVRALENMCGGISKQTLAKLLPEVGKMTPAARSRKFKLAIDRAASVVPAMRVYLLALEATGAARLHAVAGGLCQSVITDIAKRIQ